MTQQHIPSLPVHFFVIGAQRCGTTFLRRALAQHRDISMAEPERPEPKALLADTFGSVQRDAYVHAWFPQPTAVLGEKSTSYLDHDLALERIAGFFPGAPILVMVRDPVERAISHHAFSVAGGFETRPADEVLGHPHFDDRPFDATRVSTSPFAYHRRGEYVTRIRRAMQLLAGHPFRVLVAEELFGVPEAIEAVYDFVGASRPHPTIVSADPVNRATDRAEIEPSTRRRLVEHFAPWNAQLAELLGRELPWQTTAS